MAKYSVCIQGFSQGGRTDSLPAARGMALKFSERYQGTNWEVKEGDKILYIFRAGNSLEVGVDHDEPTHRDLAFD